MVNQCSSYSSLYHRWPTGWKCLKRIKFRLREPWECEGSNNIDTDEDKAVMHCEESTEMYKNLAMGTNHSDETETNQLETN